MIVRGIHLPEGDQHFKEQIEAGPLYRNKGTYQFAKLQAALEVCGDRRGHAVDVGAHVGLWSRVLSYEFKRVTAFEPIAEYAECFRKNLARRGGVTLHEIALAGEAGDAFFGVSLDGIGTAHFALDGDHQIKMQTLDSFRLEGMDFLKVDCEGAEVLVIKGGEETIRRDKPLVICEQKPKRTATYGFPRMGAVDLLQSWGAELVAEMKGDFLLAWSA